MTRVPNESNDTIPAEDTGSELDDLLRRAAKVSRATVAPELPQVGQIIGNKYRIAELLGRGGMGAVFSARHLVSEKTVALKWMLRSTTDEAAHRRFLREALAAGRIDHPNVVDVYDVGHEGESAYLVMEFLHGESLRSRLACGPMPIVDAISVLLPAMRGVAAAHRVGVVHRDLKPDNIFLCCGPDGAVREAKVLDFGISAVTSRDAAMTALTKDGALLGTPAYMSPEQFESARNIDARTDVYALGVILYEVFTGAVPFDADSYPGLVLAVVHEPPRPPSEVRPGLPPELERVVLRALAKRPEQRYASVEDLIDALAPFAGRLESAGLPTLGLRRVRARLLWSVVALVGALGLLSLGYLWLFDQEPLASGGKAESARSATSNLQAPVGQALGSTIDTAAQLHAASQAPHAYPSRAPTASDVPAPPSAAAERESAPSKVTAADPAHPPRSCEAARTAGHTTDGLIRVDPDGSGPMRPFKVFCAGMSGALVSTRAREYLPLAHGTLQGESELNETRFTYAGGPCPCPDLVRHFTHVRLDPRTLSIDPNDGSFARYDRPLTCEVQHRHQCGESTELTWGGAGSCRAARDTSGSASIDLRGTPFALAPHARFVPAGFGAAGAATIADDRKTAQFSGGGLCGSLVPETGRVPLVIAW